MRLEITGGEKDAINEFSVEEGETYYVHHEVSATLGSRLASELELVPTFQGEKLLRETIGGICMEQKEARSEHGFR
jgi:hypothetical protein